MDTGAPLLQIEPDAAGDTVSSAESVVFGASLDPGAEGGTRSSHRQSLEELRQLMLGFDVDPKQSARLLAEWTKNGPVESDETRESEDEVLNIFVDICSLFQREPQVNHRASGEEPSAEAYLFSYLRMLDTGGEGLPPAFVSALQRALAYYGVRSLDRSPELEESLLWIYKSHQRVEQQIAPVLGVLERRLRRADAPAPQAEESFRTLLDRMISMTNGLFPAVSDLAREVRYRYFDQPLFERARKQVYDQVEDHLAYMAANPDAADRHERLRALVECPQPLARLIVRPLRHCRSCDAQVDAGGNHVAILPDSGPRKPALFFGGWTAATHRLNTIMKGSAFTPSPRHAEYSQLSEAVRAMFPLIAEVPADHDIVIDFYVWHSGGLGDPEATQQEVRIAAQPGWVFSFHPAHRGGRGRSRPWPRHRRHAAFHLSPLRKCV